jgi:hypothetical protein
MNECLLSHGWSPDQTLMRQQHLCMLTPDCLVGRPATGESHSHLNFYIFGTLKQLNWYLKTTFGKFNE